MRHSFCSVLPETGRPPLRAELRAVTKVAAAARQHTGGAA
jgi:hypothetical protein